LYTETALTYMDSNLPFILNIGGAFDGLSYKIKNISIPCTAIAGCPNFIHGIKGATNLQQIKISNIRYYLTDNFKN
jgi:hypothetical protein